MVLLYEEHGNIKYKNVILNFSTKRLQRSDNMLILLGRMFINLVCEVNDETVCDKLIKTSVQSLAIRELRADWAFTAMNFVVGIYPRLIVQNKVRACQITWNILRSYNIITRGAKRLSLLTHFLAGLHYHFTFEEVHTIGDEIVFYLSDQNLAPQTSEEHTYLAYAYLFMQEARRRRCNISCTEYAKLAFRASFNHNLFVGRFALQICRHILLFQQYKTLALNDTQRKVMESILNVKAADRRTNDIILIEIWRYRYNKLCC